MVETFIPTNMLVEVQRIQFELLCEADRIFRQHSIRYCLAFGTLLGAVRHHGFIPWDDDVDIHVYSEDNGFAMAALKSELDAASVIFDPSSAFQLRLYE